MSAPTLELRVDGVAVTVPAGTALLEVCDRAGRYVPRLCYYPGLDCCSRAGMGGLECGLCAVRLRDGGVVLACVTPAAPGTEVITDDPEIHALRLERLANILTRHPHVCLACPDRDGCYRDECTYGHPPEARCCDELGRCELGKLVSFVDSDRTLARGTVTVPRDRLKEGRIQREPGLCIGCGRCVVVCETSPEAGRALKMAAIAVGAERPASASDLVAQPKQGTLRASCCTFCGQCVMVCPTGALTAPGEEGAQWLAGRRAKSGVVAPVLPPAAWEAIDPARLADIPTEAGTFQLMDGEGRVLRIGGAADLRQGVTQALTESACSTAAYFRLELDPLYTQRESELLACYAQEHGGLPAGNDLSDDLYDDLSGDDL